MASHPCDVTCVHALEHAHKMHAFVTHVLLLHCLPHIHTKEVCLRMVVDVCQDLQIVDCRQRWPVYMHAYMHTSVHSLTCTGDNKQTQRLCREEDPEAVCHTKTNTNVSAATKGAVLCTSCMTPSKCMHCQSAQYRTSSRQC